jgi:membrane-associated phospholipid phosphatase
MALMPLWAIDQELFRFIHVELRRTWLDPAAHIVTLSGLGYVQGLALVLAALRHKAGPVRESAAAVALAAVCMVTERSVSAGPAFLGLWWIVRRFSSSACWWAVAALAVSGLLRLAIVPWVGRERPSNFAFAQPLEPVFGRTSLPSGHATTTFAVFFMLAWLSGPKAALAVMGAWAVAVALSRVYVGVHYPLDVVAGAALGLATASGLASVAFHRTAAREVSSESPTLRNLS